MLVQVVHDKAAAGDHFHSVGADQSQRAFDQFRGDAAAAQASRGFGMRDDDGRRRPAVVRERLPALDVELEAGEGFVVADAACRHLSIPGENATRI
jgi:hypothetical protein